MSKFLTSKIIVIVLGVALLSCEKEPVEVIIPEVPEALSFEKRVLLEPTVSTSCGACPLMHHEIEQVEQEYEQVFHMSHYTGGPMYHPFTGYILSDVDKTVYTPLAHVNRAFEEGSMVYYQVPAVEGLVQAALANEAQYAISVGPFLQGNDQAFSITLQARSESELGELMLHAFIVEKEVSKEGPEYDQRNYGNDTPDHPYYGRGNWIEGFSHTNVIHEVLTEYQGDSISLDALDPVEFTFNVNSESEVNEHPDEFAVIVAISKPGERLQPFLNVAYASF